MSTIHENLTSQVDGVSDTFTTVNDISDGVVIDHNGQVVSPTDVTILTSTSFQLSFVPQILPNTTDTLGAFITPNRFDITSQVDGISTVFFAAPADLGEGDFLAILNGQILADETRTLSQTSFRLFVPPQVGDTLEYFRVQDITQIACSDVIDGIVKVVEIVGVVSEPENVLGIIQT